MSVFRELLSFGETKVSVFTCGDECACEFRDDQHALPIYVQVAYLEEAYFRCDFLESVLPLRSAAISKASTVIKEQAARFLSVLDKVPSAPSTEEVLLCWKTALRELVSVTALYPSPVLRQLEADVARMLSVRCDRPISTIVVEKEASQMPRLRYFRFDRDRSVALGTCFSLGFVDCVVSYTDKRAALLPSFSSRRQPEYFTASVPDFKKIAVVMLVQLFTNINEMRSQLKELLMRRYDGGIYLHNEFFCFDTYCWDDATNPHTSMKLAPPAMHVHTPSCEYLESLREDERADRWLMHTCASMLYEHHVDQSVPLRFLPRRPAEEEPAAHDIALVMPATSKGSSTTNMPEFLLLIDLLYRGAISSLSTALTLCEVGILSEIVPVAYQETTKEVLACLETGKGLGVFAREISGEPITFRGGHRTGQLVLRKADPFTAYLSVASSFVDCSYANEAGYGVAVNLEILESFLVAYMKHTNALVALSPITGVAEIRSHFSPSKDCQACVSAGLNPPDCFEVCRSKRVTQAVANAVFFFVQSARPMSFSLGALLVGASCGLPFDARVFAESLLFYDMMLMSRYQSCDTHIEFTSESVHRRFLERYQLFYTERPPIRTLRIIPPTLSVQLLCRVVNGATFGQLCGDSHVDVSVDHLKVALLSMLALSALKKADVITLVRTLREQSADTFDIQAGMVSGAPESFKVQATERSCVLTSRIAREYRDSIRRGERESIHISFVSNLVLLLHTAASFRAISMLVVYIGKLDSADKLHRLYYALTSQRRIPIASCVRAKTTLERTPRIVDSLVNGAIYTLTATLSDSFADVWSPQLTIFFAVADTLSRMRGESFPSWLAISVGLHSVHSGPWVDSDALFPTASTCTRSLLVSPTLDFNRFAAGMDMLCASADYFSDP